jgi:hypothetical protein
MRAVELLNALAQGPGGISIEVYPTNGTSAVGTYYAPFVKGVGKNLTAAAMDCAYWLLDVVKDRPEYNDSIPNVLAALARYNIQPKKATR